SMVKIPSLGWSSLSSPNASHGQTSPSHMGQSSWPQSGIGFLLGVEQVLEFRDRVHAVVGVAGGVGPAPPVEGRLDVLEGVQQPIAFLDQLSDTGVSGFARVCGAPVKFVQDCLFDVAGGVVGASPGGVAGGIVGIERTKPFGLDDVDDAVVKARG